MSNVNVSIYKLVYAVTCYSLALNLILHISTSTILVINYHWIVLLKYTLFINSPCVHIMFYNPFKLLTSFMQWNVHYNDYVHWLFTQLAYWYWIPYLCYLKSPMDNLQHSRECLAFTLRCTKRKMSHRKA